MPSTDKIDVMILKSFLESERIMLTAMVRRHQEHINHTLDAFEGEPYHALDAYDEALHGAIENAEKVCRLMANKISTME